MTDGNVQDEESVELTIPMKTAHHIKEIGVAYRGGGIDWYEFWEQWKGILEVARETYTGASIEISDTNENRAMRSELVSVILPGDFVTVINDLDLGNVSPTATRYLNQYWETIGRVMRWKETLEQEHPNHPDLRFIRESWQDNERPSAPPETDIGAKGM